MIYVLEVELTISKREASAPASERWKAAWPAACIASREEGDTWISRRGIMRENRSRIVPFVTAIAVLLLTVAAAPEARAQVFVQGFDETRDGPPSPFATRGIVTSPYYESIRQAVRARYGGAVVFGSPSWPDGVSAITAGVLAESDIFVITGTNVGLTSEEVCLLDAFVEQGGAVLSFRNEWMARTILSTEPGSFGGSGQARVLDPSSPIIAGPFGTVDSTVSLGANTEYLSTGPGYPLLVDAKRVVMVSFGSETGHRGRAVVIGDEEIFLNGPVPFGASTRGEFENNQRLFVNIIDYLINVPGLDAEGVEALGACSDRDGDGSDDLQDCDDEAAHVHPGATELLDGSDNDCDGEVDEGTDDDGDGVPNLMDACTDTPSDSAVDSGGCAVSCEDPAEDDPDQDEDGFGLSTDCDDFDPETHPGAVELPGNGADEDCDGELACDPQAEWRNHGQFVSCVGHAVETLVQSGRISIELGLSLIEQAARSEVGRDRSTREERGKGRG